MSFKWIHLLSKKKYCPKYEQRKIIYFLWKKWNNFLFCFGMCHSHGFNLWCSHQVLFRCSFLSNQFLIRPVYCYFENDRRKRNWIYLWYVQKEKKNIFFCCFCWMGINKPLEFNGWQDNKVNMNIHTIFGSLFFVFFFNRIYWSKHVDDSKFLIDTEWIDCVYVCECLFFCDEERVFVWLYEHLSTVQRALTMNADFHLALDLYLIFLFEFRWTVSRFLFPSWLVECVYMFSLKLFLVAI